MARALADHQSTKVLNFGTTGGWHENVINKPGAVGAASNKRLALVKMAEAGVPIPALVRATNGRLLYPGYPVIGRPDQHSKGKQLWLCTSQREMDRASRLGATHFMKKIEAPYEFRVHVIGGNSVKMTQKVGGRGFIRNHRYGWRFMGPTIERRDPAREAAKKAVAALGLDFGAVDVLFDGTNAWVLEVNTAPSLMDTTLDTYVKTIKELW